MNTQELIADLASRATPVTPLRPPAVRLAAWASVAIACAALGVAIFGVRHNLPAVIGQASFWTTAAIAAGLAVCAAGAALVLAVPGAERTPILRGGASLLVVAWAVVLVAGIAGAGHGFQRVADWPICAARVIGIGLIPALLLFRMLRLAAPLQQGWAAATAAAASMAVAGGAIQFICPLSDPGHALLAHFGPVAVVGLVAALAARKLLN